MRLDPNNKVMKLQKKCLGRKDSQIENDANLI
jgi:hypothetical protein